MARAVHQLIKNPQNNLRIFRNSILRWNTPGKDDSLVEIVHQLMGPKCDVHSFVALIVKSLKQSIDCHSSPKHENVALTQANLHCQFHALKSLTNGKPIEFVNQCNHLE